MIGTQIGVVLVVYQTLEILTIMVLVASQMPEIIMVLVVCQKLETIAPDPQRSGETEPTRIRSTCPPTVSLRQRRDGRSS